MFHYLSNAQFNFIGRGVGGANVCNRILHKELNNDPFLGILFFSKEFLTFKWSNIICNEFGGNY